MTLTDPRHLASLLKKHGVEARKGLGQHFLISSNVVGQICGQCEGMKGVLEIGPGPGVLTSPLSEAAELIALELDPRMAAVLADSAPKAHVLLADALTEDLGAILAQLPEPRCVVSNLPYYITGPLIARIAAHRGKFARAVLMMQFEVASRLLAEPGDSARGAVSVILQQQFRMRRVCKVPASAFHPPPKVDSAVLLLEPASDSSDPSFERWVRQGFAQPRKTVANNLMGSGMPRAMVEAAMDSAHLDHRIRAHMLTQAQWIVLASALEAA